MAAKIVLFSERDGKGRQKELFGNDHNLLATGRFNSAKVDKGQCILYRYACYNPNCWGADNIQVLTEGTPGAVNFKFVPESIRIVETFGSEGVTVYKHNDYCGTQQVIVESTPQIHVGGASSIIVSGGIWTLFTQGEFRGGEKSKYQGLYPTPAEMDFPNDTLASIQKDQ